MIRGKSVAVITGGARGIGKATAILLAGKGVSVVICSRTGDEVNGAVNDITAVKSPRADVLGLRCDVSVGSQVDALFGAARQLGSVNILVNNAGIAVVKKATDTSEKEWDDTIDCNLKSAFLCTRAALPTMLRKNSGVIINVSSGAGKAGFANLSAYCASKFGMQGLTESIAWDVADEGAIRVMSICPGEVATKMQEYCDPKYYLENKNAMLQPEQVASKILEMITDEKRYRNGQSVDLP